MRARLTRLADILELPPPGAKTQQKQKQLGGDDSGGGATGLGGAVLAAPRLLVVAPEAVERNLEALRGLLQVGAGVIAKRLMRKGNSRPVEGGGAGQGAGQGC